MPLFWYLLRRDAVALNNVIGSVHALFRQAIGVASTQRVVHLEGSSV